MGAAAAAVAAVVQAVVKFVLEEIEAGRMDVEKLRQNPIEYFVSQYGEEIKARAEAEGHLPD